MSIRTELAGIFVISILAYITITYPQN